MELPNQMLKMKTMVEAPKILASHLKMMIMGPNMMINNSSTGGEGVWIALAKTFKSVKWRFCNLWF